MARKKKVMTQKEFSSKGGQARMKGVTKEQRSEYAKAGWDTRRKNQAKV